jgi:guanine deaminase
VDAFFIIVGPEVGNFEVGREADFVVVDPGSTALMTNRMENVKDCTEEFFVFLVLGDDRAVAATYVLGDCLYRAS